MRIPEHLPDDIQRRIYGLVRVLRHPRKVAPVELHTELLRYTATRTYYRRLFGPGRDADWLENDLLRYLNTEVRLCEEVLPAVRRVLRIPPSATHVECYDFVMRRAYNPATIWARCTPDEQGGFVQRYVGALDSG